MVQKRRMSLRSNVYVCVFVRAMNVFKCNASKNSWTGGQAGECGLYRSMSYMYAPIPTLKNLMTNSALLFVQITALAESQRID